MIIITMHRYTQASDNSIEKKKKKKKEERSTQRKEKTMRNDVVVEARVKDSISTADFHKFFPAVSWKNRSEGGPESSSL